MTSKLEAFEADLGVLCEDHGCILQVSWHGNQSILVIFHDKDPEVTNPLEDITLIEDRL